MVNVIRRDFTWYGFVAISSLFGWGLYLTAVVLERKWYVGTTANGYTCLEKLTTEKCKQQAKQPEKKILKIKIL